MAGIRGTTFKIHTMVPLPVKEKPMCRVERNSNTRFLLYTCLTAVRGSVEWSRRQKEEGKAVPKCPLRSHDRAFGVCWVKCTQKSFMWRNQENNNSHRYDFIRWEVGNYLEISKSMATFITIPWLISPKVRTYVDMYWFISLGRTKARISLEHTIQQEQLS